MGFNSVGFYQMTKLAIIPCTVLIQAGGSLRISTRPTLNLLLFLRVSV